jgi:hypothetical protein
MDVQMHTTEMEATHSHKLVSIIKYKQSNQTTHKKIYTRNRI